MEGQERDFFMKLLRIDDSNLSDIVKDVPNFELDLFTAQFSPKDKEKMMTLLNQAFLEKEPEKRTELLKEINLFCKKNYAPNSLLGSLARKLGLK